MTALKGLNNNVNDRCLLLVHHGCLFWHLLEPSRDWSSISSRTIPIEYAGSLATGFEADFARL